MLSLDKFPYPRKQTRGNEFIPCSIDACYFLKRVHSFRILAIALISPNSLYKQSVSRSHHCGKQIARIGIPSVRSSVASLCVYCMLMTSNGLYILRLLANQKRDQHSVLPHGSLDIFVIFDGFNEIIFMTHGSISWLQDIFRWKSKGYITLSCLFLWGIRKTLAAAYYKTHFDTSSTETSIQWHIRHYRVLKTRPNIFVISQEIADYVKTWPW